MARVHVQVAAVVVQAFVLIAQANYVTQVSGHVSRAVI